MSKSRTTDDGRSPRSKKNAGAPSEGTRGTKAAKPRIRASHAERSGRIAPAGSSRSGAAERGRRSTETPRPRRPRRDEASEGPVEREIETLSPRVRAVGTVRKAPVAPPRRAVARRPAEVEASAQARETALRIAASGMEKKALGIEILDVTGRVDYADFIVVMTGRSDRHVHAIATGIEDSLRKDRQVPLSVEGLTAATWVLIDFGDVVVHVFQEDTRRLYDIEGLWIDASRVPVPDVPDVPRN